MGIFIFWIQYIIAGILLYHILRCIYVKADVNNINYHHTKYKRTDHDERLKYPLWLILTAVILFSIPFLNIIVFAIYIGYRTLCEDGDEYNPYYCKSLFTKKY